jgi:hypothetical protein
MWLSSRHRGPRQCTTDIVLWNCSNFAQQQLRQCTRICTWSPSPHTSQPSRTICTMCSSRMRCSSRLLRCKMYSTRLWIVHKHRCFPKLNNTGRVLSTSKTIEGSHHMTDSTCSCSYTHRYQSNSCTESCECTRSPALLRTSRSKLRASGGTHRFQSTTSTARWSCKTLRPRHWRPHMRRSSFAMRICTDQVHCTTCNYCSSHRRSCLQWLRCTLRSSLQRWLWRSTGQWQYTTCRWTCCRSTRFR